jgi:hypothetical protein
VVLAGRYNKDRLLSGGENDAQASALCFSSPHPLSVVRWLAAFAALFMSIPTGPSAAIMRLVAGQLATRFDSIQSFERRGMS